MNFITCYQVCPIKKVSVCVSLYSQYGQFLAFVVTVPPWGCLRPISDDDAAVLQPLVERMNEQDHVAVPAGFYHTADILDVRIITARKAESLLANRFWKPKTDWILQSGSLLCCWQDDSADLTDTREYLPYIIDLMKARKRLTKVEASSREYQPYLLRDRVVA